MKNNSYVRKIDGLGRIVIPKDVREELNINYNDHLEIINYNEFLIIRKHSKLNKLKQLLQDVTDIMNEYLNTEIFIAEKDTVVAYSGVNKELYLNKRPSKKIIKSIERREQLFEKYKKNIEIIDNINIECTYINEAIVVNNEVVGIICLYRTKNIVDEYDYNIVKSAKKFIESYIENI